MEDDAVLYVFDTRDGESFFVCFGVPAGYQHDTHGTAFVDFQCPSVEVALCHAFLQNKVATSNFTLPVAAFLTTLLWCAEGIYTPDRILGWAVCGLTAYFWGSCGKNRLPMPRQRNE